MSPTNIYREIIKEPRKRYFVSYQPADCRFSFALISLVFLEERIEKVEVAQAMEREYEHWLKRYPVPVMVSAFDAKEVLIHPHGDLREHHLSGYRDLKTGQFVRRWGTFKENELPIEQVKPEYHQCIYRDVSFREQAAVREQSEREARTNRRTVWTIVFFIIGMPILIEILSLGISWLGYLLSAISIAAGFHKAAKTLGWIKPSERDKKEADEELKMRHYYYHCERNPEAFDRLKIQNFEREQMEQIRKEAESLGVVIESRK